MENIEITQPILQYPTDLVFAVTDTDVSHLLTTLKTHTISIYDFSVRFTIIGESHCITVRHHDEIVLQEVLACTDIPAILQADSHKFAKLDTYQHKRQGYQSTIWFADSIQKREWQAQKEIHLEFPKIFGQIPYTTINWVTSNSCVRWRTLHAYHLETYTTYVHTESYFDVAERGTHE